MERSGRFVRRNAVFALLDINDSRKKNIFLNWPIIVAVRKKYKTEMGQPMGKLLNKQKRSLQKEAAETGQAW